MSFPSLQLTNAGRQIIIKAFSGDCGIVFTKFGVGNGDAPIDVNALTNIKNLVKNVSINEITTGDGCANLTGTLDNANIETGFWWREIGIFATDPDDGEVLYAYAHAGEYAEYIPAYSNQAYLRTTLNVTVVVGDTENVNAVLGEYAGYVTQEDLLKHTVDANNPHSVTKEQVGLGNVPNVSTEDQTPSFSVSDGVSEINSGERLSVILGKVKAAISSIISHFNSNNPHNITCGKIGAATSGHRHDAFHITSGILGPARGGTGVNSLSALSSKLAPYLNTPVFGVYTGDGEAKRLISLGFTPSAIIVCDPRGVMGEKIPNDFQMWGGICVGSYCIHSRPSKPEFDTTWVDDGYYSTALMIADGGFYVANKGSQGSRARTNINGITYRYIAFR